MSLAQQLTEYISACFTGLWVQSHEHDDALAEIAGLCRDQNWRLAVRDIASGCKPASKRRRVVAYPRRRQSNGRVLPV